MGINNNLNVGGNSNVGRIPGSDMNVGNEKLEPEKKLLPLSDLKVQQEAPKPSVSNPDVGHPDRFIRL